MSLPSDSRWAKLRQVTTTVARMDNDTNLFVGLWRLIVHIRAHYQAKKYAVIMWQLADELGYTAKDIKRLSGTKAYGIYDWEGSRPKNHSFYPDPEVIAKVIDALFALRDGQATKVDQSLRS